jgi:hypothetical protein
MKTKNVTFAKPDNIYIVVYIHLGEILELDREDFTLIKDSNL